MKKIPVSMMAITVIVSLIVGGTIGFFLGITSTKAGASFLAEITEQEVPAETTTPTKFIRDGFELRYPANWEIDETDKDYDPDQMFSIDSPGATYVMFMLDELETDPAKSLQEQVDSFSKLMGTPVTQTFENYGSLHGKGAILQGKFLGTQVTIKAFACYFQGMTAIIIQQYPDEDIEYVKNGLALIEKSFVLKPKKQADSSTN